MPNNVIECKACSAPIDLSAAVNGVVECGYCHRKQTVARSTNADAMYFLKMGEHDLDCCEFDTAYTAYKKASEYDSHESEAYWGMALAEHKVQYIKDNVNNRLQPICHEISDKVFSENKNYQAALLCASPEQQELYKLRAQEIDEVRKEFYELKNSGLDYDCFICVKVSDDKGGRTSDYKIADDLYFYLRDKGYTPFFSEREIKNRTGADYEALILYALYSSECMIVVCSNEDYLKTPWVQNEYTRFMSMINDEQKERDAITIAFSGRPIEKLPGRNGKIQGVDMNKIDASERIVSFVQTHTPEAQARRKNAERLKQLEEERIKVQLEELKAQQEAARLELDRKLAAAQSRGTPTPQPTGGATVQSLLTRAEQFLNDGEFNNARQYCNRVLDIDPENGEAWFLLLLIENNVMPADKYLSIVNKMRTPDDVTQLLNSKHYRNAQKYADNDGRFIALDKALNEKEAQLLERERIEYERRMEQEKRIREKKEIEQRRSSLQSQLDNARNRLSNAKRDISELESETAGGLDAYKKRYVGQKVDARMKGDENIMLWVILLFAFWPAIIILLISKAAKKSSIKKQCLSELSYEYNSKIEELKRLRASIPELEQEVKDCQSRLHEAWKK